MRVPDHPTLILRMLQHRLKKLATSSPVLAASFGTYTHRCGRTSCRCHHGGPLHVGQHLTLDQDDVAGDKGEYRNDHERDCQRNRQRMIQNLLHFSSPAPAQLAGKAPDKRRAPASAAL